MKKMFLLGALLGTLSINAQEKEFIHPMRVFTFMPDSSTTGQVNLDVPLGRQASPSAMNFHAKVMCMTPNYHPFILEVRAGSFHGYPEATLSANFGKVFAHEECDATKYVITLGVTDRLTRIEENLPHRNQEVHNVGFRTHAFFASQDKRTAGSAWAEYYPWSRPGMKWMYQTEFHLNLRPAHRAPILAGVMITNRYGGVSSVKEERVIQNWKVPELKFVATSLLMKGHMRLAGFIGTQSRGLSLGYNFF